MSSLYCEPKVMHAGSVHRRMQISDALEGSAGSEEIRFIQGRCTLGHVLAAFSRIGVVSILVREDAEQLFAELQERFPMAQLAEGDQEDRGNFRSIVQFVESPVGELDLPLDLRGTAFQRRVWRAVQQIPFGETSTYAEIADRIGAPRAARAVGSACCRNYLAFVIPCHRVLRSDGSFSGMVDRQEELIRREGA
jgi:AraC family transcriptional regulator of adaptative response/methylated-DNA-[protein]-cysteine methyltransferase